ncbi:MAG: zinc-dependent metalloprotease [Acidimicrobiaceae bacterium]|nr:zinc-dependent metalloprotease [Acidimicrobiia bacterium]MCY4495052.1 zinc-dependent metalloprotease [Acidimicrobiaceae bacterium]
MSDDLPPDGESLGAFLGEVMKMLSGAAGSPAGSARDLARSIATGGESEPNIDPKDRIKIEELLRVAELQVESATRLAVARGGALRVEVVNRSQWVDRTIEQYRPLLKALAESISAVLPTPDELPENDPMGQMMAGLQQMLESMLSAMTTGAMVGELAQVAFGGFHLPLPRPADAQLLVLLPNVDRFGQEWSLDADDLRLWVCLHEAAHCAVLGVPHVGERLRDLLQRYAGAFERDPETLRERLSGFDLNAGPEALIELNRSLSDPELIFGAVRSPMQAALEPEIAALLAAVGGYVDHVMDQTGGSIIGSYGRVTEALRRRRTQADGSDRLVERLLGFELDQSHFDRGSAFVEGVIERAGTEGLDRLFEDPQHLPTPSEVDAPGLWLARIDLPSI